MRLFGRGSEKHWPPHECIEWDSELDRYRWRFTHPAAVYASIELALNEASPRLWRAIEYAQEHRNAENVFGTVREVDIEIAWDSHGYLDPDFGDGFDRAVARRKRQEARTWYEAAIASDAENPPVAFEAARSIGLESYTCDPNDLVLALDWAERARYLQDHGAHVQTVFEILMRLETARRRLLQIGTDDELVYWAIGSYRGFLGAEGDGTRSYDRLESLAGVAGPAMALVAQIVAMQQAWKEWESGLAHQIGGSEYTNQSLESAGSSRQSSQAAVTDASAGYVAGRLKTALTIVKRIPRPHSAQEQLAATTASLGTLAAGSYTRLAVCAVRLLGETATSEALSKLEQLRDTAQFEAVRKAADGGVAHGQALVSERGVV